MVRSRSNFYLVASRVAFSRLAVSRLSIHAVAALLAVAMLPSASLRAQHRAVITPGGSEQLRPLTMVSADFDEDGAPDIIVGYASGTGGAIELLRGNPDALAPHSREAFEAAEHGQSVDAFLPGSQPVQLKTAPAFMLAADVDGDGHRDLVYAGKNSGTLQVMFGTGHGDFRKTTSSFALPGVITTIASYRPGAPLTGEALLVGYQTAQGARLGIVSQSKAGLALNARYSLPGAATQIAVAQLDSDLTPDAAIVAGGQLLVLHGYQAILGKGHIETLPESNVQAVTAGTFLYDRHAGTQLAVLDASGNIIILAHQGFDVRPLTAEEAVENRRMARLHGNGLKQLARLTADNGSAPWMEVERQAEPALQSFGSEAPLLLRARTSGIGGDDLAVIDPATGQRVTISHRFESGAALKAGAVANSSASSLRRVKVDNVSSGGVAAAVAMRVSMDGRPGIVALHKNDPSLDITIPAADNTLYVTSTADAAPDSPNGTLCSNPTITGCTLRDAVTFANTDADENTLNGGSDTIFVPAGTYELTYQAGHLDSGDNAETHLELYGPVTIIGSGAASTIIDGDQNDMIFNVNPGPFGTYNQATYGDASYVTFDATLESLTLEKGENPNNPNKTNPTGDENNLGGCIFWTATGGGNLSLSSVDIQNCTAQWGGGGAIYAVGDQGDETLTLTNSTLSRNTTSESGGAINIAFPPVALNATNATFSSNSASATLNTGDPGSADGGDDGGALFLTARPSGSSTAQTVLDGVSIVSNAANGAGGGISSTTGFNLENATIQQNSSVNGTSAGLTNSPDGYNGGGVYVEVASPEVTASISSTNLLGNSAVSSGGGVAQGPESIADGNTMTISLSRFYGNSSAANPVSNGLAVGQPGTPTGTTLVGQVTATDNWWGCNAGPLSSGKGCDGAKLFPAGDANGTMTVTPYAQLAIGATSTTVPLGDNLPVTVTLNSDSGGNPIIDAFPAVTGYPITYDVTGVSVTSQLNTMDFASDGTNSPTITTDSVGSGKVSATFDGQTVSLNFSVPEAPSITSAASTTFIEGTAGSFTVTTTGAPTPAISESGPLPTGVTFVDNGNGTATLAGTATASGTFPLTITADNGVSPAAQQSFTLTVNPPQVALTETANPTAGGTVTPGSGSFFQGTVVPITATPNTGYSFVRWTSNPDAVANAASASTTITMNAAETVTAIFGANLVVNTTADDAGLATNCTVQPNAGVNTADAACSLRDALQNAANITGAAITFDSTVFASAQTISIIAASGTLTIPANTSIIGPTSGSGYSLTNLLTVKGGSAGTNFPVFTVDGDVANTTIANLTITGGNVTGGVGGGIQADPGSVLTVSHCTVSGNNAATGSGGVYTAGGTLTVIDSTISNNHGVAGGLSAGPGGSMTVLGSTISGNFASVFAGGIYNFQSTVTVTNSTIDSNTAVQVGGAIYNDSGALTLANSIVTGNTAPSDADIDGTYTDGGGNQVSTSVSLAPLASYGGPTQTMIPLPGSAAICAGMLANATAAGISADQRGFAFDPNCPAGKVDSGAVQSNYAIAFTVEPPSPMYPGEAMRPSPRLGLTESGIPAMFASSIMSMTDSASVLGGTLTAITGGGVAVFGNLTTTGPVDSDTLTASLSLNPALSPALGLSAQSGSFQAAAPKTAALTSPTPSSTLTGASVTFTWSAGTGVEDYELLIGSYGVGSADLYNSGPTLSTSETVTLPTIGATIYVRFRQMISGLWQQTDFTYTEFGSPSPATITSPAAGSTLSSANTTFTWTGGVGVTDYVLEIGTTAVGSANVYDSGITTATSETVTVPAIGAPLYVRLRQRFNGAWQNFDYVYTESGSPTPATITSPAANSTLTGSSVTFTWSGGVGVQDYDLTVGTTGAGSSNVYDSGATQATSETVTVPTTGARLYVRLRQRLNGVWQNFDYTYTEQ